MKIQGTLLILASLCCVFSNALPTNKRNKAGMCKFFFTTWSMQGHCHHVMTQWPDCSIITWATSMHAVLLFPGWKLLKFFCPPYHLMMIHRYWRIFYCLKTSLFSMPSSHDRYINKNFPLSSLLWTSYCSPYPSDFGLCIETHIKSISPLFH